MSLRNEELNELTELFELIDLNGNFHDLDQQSPQFGTGQLLLKLMRHHVAMNDEVDSVVDAVALGLCLDVRELKNLIDKNWTEDEVQDHADGTTD